MSRSKTPVVSVIVPAFNVGPYIAETLESIFAQTYRDFEVITINDGSTDDTEERIGPFLDRIVYLKQRNSGVMAARNAGLRVARGQYIALLDGDDMWLPRYLETLVEMLEADPAVSVVYPNAIFYGSPQFSGRLFQDVFPAADPITFDRVLKRQCYIFSSAVFRRSVIDEIGMYDESLHGQGAEDFDLWLRMLQAGYRFKYTTEPLVKYCWRANSLSNTGVGLLRCVISVYEKLIADERTTHDQRTWIGTKLPDFRAQLSLARFKESMKTGDYRAAASQLAAANAYRRSLKLKLMQTVLRVTPGLVRQWVMR